MKLPVKLCKDCKWAKPDRLFFIFKRWRWAECTNPRFADEPIARRVHLGDPRTTSVSPTFCSTARRREHMCGIDAKHFEPKGG